MSDKPLEDIGADDVGIPEVDDPKRDVGVAFPWRLILVLTIFALVVVFILQNTGSVDIEFLGWDFRAPLIALLVGSMVLAVLLGDLLDVWWNRRKKKKREG